MIKLHEFNPMFSKVNEAISACWQKVIDKNDNDMYVIDITFYRVNMRWRKVSIGFCLIDVQTAYNG